MAMALPTTTTTDGPLALVVHPDESAELTRLPGPTDDLLATLHKIVGGYVRDVGAARNTWVAYVNEDGERLQLPRNLVADAIVRALGWHFRPGDFLVGPAVFLGRTGSQETDVPAEVLDLARAAGLIR
jgi:hypothetical protein